MTYGMTDRAVVMPVEATTDVIRDSDVVARPVGVASDQASGGIRVRRSAFATVDGLAVARQAQPA